MYKTPYPTTHTRKRTHLKPSQVAVLQESFVTNPLPDATIRTQLSKELAVTERTVQIWFQNRRAKARKSEASLEPNVRTGWIDLSSTKMRQKAIEPFQATFRTMVTPECYEESNPIKKRPRSSSKPEKMRDDMTILSQRAKSEGICDESFISVPVTTLRIGTWARFASLIHENEYDLVCFGNNNQLMWQVRDIGHQFRIHIDYNNVKYIKLGYSHFDLGQLEIELSNEVSFSMKRSGIDLDWIPCGDFTENKQASNHFIHILQGDHNHLKQSVLEMLAHVPQLASKLILHDTLPRDLSISPSATPEPIYFDQNNQWLDQKDSDNHFLSHQSHWLLDPFFDFI